MESEVRDVDGGHQLVVVAVIAAVIMCANAGTIVA
jgi:hypothetical protein